VLRSTKEILGYRVDAIDGTLGKVRDVYFDDRGWTFRYFVVDTGTWLPDRLVLISPQAVGEPDWTARLVPVERTKEQVENAPSTQHDLPVSRQHEMELALHYRWAPYWGAALEPGLPVLVEPAEKAETQEEAEGDPHLRSLKEVLGYHIQARDGEIGHVEDMIAQTDAWVIRYMVVDTRNWLPGRKVLVAPDWTHEVNWDSKLVKVAITRDAIKNSPKYEPFAPVNREYEARLYDFHGRPKYWE
jgi:uncharacterized protein YrrD